MHKFLTFISFICLLLFVACVLGLLLAYPTMLLWNGCLVPAISVLSEITWLQAWGINIIMSIWFKASLSSDKK